MTIYIAGKMSGVKDFNRPAFFEAEKRLTAYGCKVLNPAKIGELPEYELYLPINKAMLDGSDAIYLLDGWEDSPGARKELEYAKEKHLRIYHQGEPLTLERTIKRKRQGSR